MLYILTILFWFLTQFKLLVNNILAIKNFFIYNNLLLFLFISIGYVFSIILFFLFYSHLFLTCYEQWHLIFDYQDNFNSESTIVSHVMKDTYSSFSDIFLIIVYVNSFFFIFHKNYFFNLLSLLKISFFIVKPISTLSQHYFAYCYFAYWWN